jgi:hypothetical protein
MSAAYRACHGSDDEGLGAYNPPAMGRSGVASLVVVLAVGAAACAGDTAETPSASSVPPNDMPPCDEVYTEGAEITNESFGLACVQSGAVVSPRPVRLECTDGRELLFNDLAWGYFGQGMTLTPADDPSKMPEAAVDECLAPAPS